MRPPEQDRHRAALRIFTPVAEMAFAGHPTVGAAALLALLDGVESQAFGLEEKAGIVACVAQRRGENHAYARFRAPMEPRFLRESCTPGAAAAALGLDPGDVAAAGASLAVWSAGTAFTLVPVASLEALSRARPQSGFEDAFSGGAPPYLFVRSPGSPHLRTRMFAPGAGISEDPATGSAAAALAGHLFAQDKPGDGDHDLWIEQGVEMGRPSRIDLQMIVRAGALTGVEIGGDAVIVADGILRL